MKNSRKWKNRNPHKPTAQQPCGNTQCRPHHLTCSTLRSLHLTFQIPIECPGLATHSLAALCALWLPSSASSTEKLHQAVAKL